MADFFARLLQADETILRALIAWRSPGLNALMLAFTALGDAGGIWMMTAAILLARGKTQKQGMRLLFCFCLCLVANNLILKNVFVRPRPFDALLGVTSLTPRPRDFSFPSGHAAGAFAAAYVINRELGRKFGIPAYAAAGLIALSRVYIGVHYPSDVLGGAAVGLLCGRFGRALVTRQGRKRII